MIVDAGQVPGDAPGRLWVATSGAALPLRAQQTGPQMPGGSPHACNSETSSPNQLRSDLTYSAFNASVTIAAPSGALDLSTIAG